MKDAAYTTTRIHERADGRTVDVEKLFARIADRPIEQGPLTHLHVNRSRSTGFSPRRYAAADTSFPIILGVNDQIVDGKHRVAKLIDSGETHGPFRRVTEDDLDKSATVLDDLKRAKAESDRKNYPGKHAILRALMAADSAGFTVDSPGGRHPGITHVATGFQFHVPRAVAALATGSLPEKPAGIGQ